MRFGIIELYCGSSGKKGFYNSQEIGLAKAMRKFGHEIFIFYPNKDEKEVKEEEIEEDITIIYCPAKTFGVHARYDWNILKKYRIEVAQIGSDNQIFAPALVKYCNRNNISVYNFIGTVESDTKSNVKKRLLQLLFQRNIAVYRKSKCFVKTPAVLEKLKGYGVENITLAPVGLDTSIIPQMRKKREDILSKHGIDSDLKVLLFVGRMDSYKRPLDAISIIDRLGSGYFLIMIGTGTLDKEVERCIDKSENRDRIIWIKRIPNSEIHEYYFSCDYYLNFNENEIFGMSILEAMYSGATVIAKHAPGPDFIIEHNVSGYLADSTDDFIDLIKSGKIIAQNKAMERVKSNFVWDITADKFQTWLKMGVNNDK